MDVKVYEVVCCKGSKLGNVLDRALAELNINLEYEIVSDLQTILNQGILNTPALLIDGKVYLEGKIPTVDQVKSAILTAQKNY